MNIQDMCFEEFAFECGYKNADRQSKIEKRWCLSCTHNGPKVIPDPEPEFYELHRVLEQVFPNITVLQYARLCRLISYDTEYQRYYETETKFGVKSIRLYDLYKFIIDEQYNECV